MKKISVVVPCFNASMYLPKCMDKLLDDRSGKYGDYIGG